MTHSNANTFHRKIGLRCQPGTVEGKICDNMHHFRVWLHHDDKQVLKTRARAIRYPWSTCPQAGPELEQLVGMPLDESSAAVGRVAKATLHCTHLFDMAGLMGAHAAHDRPPWEYHCQVSEAGPGQQRATLTRNGEPLLNWHISQGVIEGEPPFHGVALEKQFIQWAEQNLGFEEVDAALILRRALKIAPARFVNLSAVGNAGNLSIPAHCYSLQPSRSNQALSMQGMTVNYNNSDDMLKLWENPDSKVPLPASNLIDKSSYLRGFNPDR